MSVKFYEPKDVKILSGDNFGKVSVYSETSRVHFDTFVHRCPGCQRWFSSTRARFTCSDACRSKISRRKHSQPADRRAAARKGAETKSFQRHELTCQVCGKAISRDGNSASRTKYCSDACKQEAYRRSHRQGETRTPRHILIDDAILTLKTAEQLWNVADYRQMHDLLNHLAQTRGGAVLAYWQSVTKRSPSPLTGPEAKLISRTVIDYMTSK